MQFDYFLPCLAESDSCDINCRGLINAHVYRFAVLKVVFVSKPSNSLARTNKSESRDLLADGNKKKKKRNVYLEKGEARGFSLCITKYNSLHVEAFAWKCITLC